MADVHPTAIIDEKTSIAQGVEIGPYCVLGPDVVLEKAVSLKSHVVIDGRTRVGAGTAVFPFSSIGLPPQDLKYAGEPSQLVIGANNTIREHVTISPGTAGGAMMTKIGDNNLIMIGVHVGHDSNIGDNTVLANNAQIGGHVTIEDYVILGAQSAVHQFVRIGRHAMIGGLSAVVRDVIPFGSVSGERAGLIGLNLVGLKRRGFSREEIKTLRDVYRLLFADEGTLTERLSGVADRYGKHQAVMEIVDFISSDSSRSVCLPRSAA
ncbi:MAG: acyl-ACP--UDP-N-acetylglucosamine O-acyltransferase [Alphaproteobacteria bacterium]